MHFYSQAGILTILCLHMMSTTLGYKQLFGRKDIGLGTNTTVSTGSYKQFTKRQCAHRCLDGCYGFFTTVSADGTPYCSPGSNPGVLSSSYSWVSYYRLVPDIEVIRRTDGSVNFTLPWANYKEGFGNENNFWLGLDNMHILTSGGRYGLRVDMSDWNNNSYWAYYSSFSVGPESDNYRLSVSGYDSSSTAGPALTCNCAQRHDGMMFTTMDRNNDNHATGCAAHYFGAWWFNACHSGHATGLYLMNGITSTQGIGWVSVPGLPSYYSFKSMFYTLKLK